jgi:Zn-dependent protease with chaperone function
MHAKTSFVARALLALALLVGFYALALALSGLLLYIPYAEWTYGRRFHIKIALACVAGAFAILKGSVFVGGAEFTPPGPEISERDHPRLFALIHDVAAQMRTGVPRRVFLVPDVNAFVTEVGGFMGFGTERVMGIGVGMLAIDSVSELKATIAHEFGHYAGGDTRLGGIIYRTRGAIFGVLGQLGDGVLSKPFEWYAKLFMRISQGVSRAQELAADRASVAIAGKQAHISGLERESRGGVLFQRFMSNEVEPLLKSGFRPDNLYVGFRDYTLELERRGALPSIDAMLKEQTTSPYDTHPALPERIAYAQKLEARALASDDTPSITLLDNADAVQERITEILAAGYAGQQKSLECVRWDEVAARVHVPKLHESSAESTSVVARALGGEANPRAALRTLVARVEQSRLVELALQLEPRLAEAPEEVRAQVSEFVVQRHVGMLLGAALVERGGAWASPVGAPHCVTLGSETLEPFALASDALSDPSKRSALLALAQA